MQLMNLFFCYLRIGFYPFKSETSSLDAKYSLALARVNLKTWLRTKKSEMFGYMYSKLPTSGLWKTSAKSSDGMASVLSPPFWDIVVREIIKINFIFFLIWIGIIFW